MNNEQKNSGFDFDPEEFISQKSKVTVEEEWGTVIEPSKEREYEKKSTNKFIIAAISFLGALLLAFVFIVGLSKMNFPAVSAGEKTNGESEIQIELQEEENHMDLAVVEVPDLKGKTLAKAKELLKKNNIAYEVFEKHSDKIEKGRIVSQSIDGGTEVAEDALIYITVSLGKEVTEKNVADKAQKSKKQVAIESVVMSPKAPELKLGESIKINVTVFPQDATKKEYMLVSDNNLVAVVGSGNTLKAVAPGKTTVNAYTPDGAHLGSMSVTVKEPVTQAATTRPAITRPAVTNPPVTVPPRTSPRTTVAPATTRYIPVTQAPVIKYKVTFDANGGSVSEASRHVQKDSVYGTLPTPTRNCFTFDGWYTEGGAKVTSSTEIAYNRDHTLVARWISGWVLENEAPGNAEIIDTKTEYKYRQKQYLFSSDPNLSYRKTGEERWVSKNETVEVKRVDKWPDDTSKTKGFCTDNNIYKTYNKALPQNTESTRYVQKSKVASGYIYWHWCYTHDAGRILNCYISTDKGATGGVFGNHTTNNFHAFVSDNPITLDSAGVFKRESSSKCPYTYWWFGDGAEQLPIYTYTYDVEQKEYEYEKWGEFSSWSSSYVAESDTVDVESRTWVKYSV